jgi:hypothetical protein
LKVVPFRSSSWAEPGQRIDSAARPVPLCGAERNGSRNTSTRMGRVMRGGSRVAFVVTNSLRQATSRLLGNLEPFTNSGCSSGFDRRGGFRGRMFVDQEAQVKS